jgi:PAS domain S-box-containing protein
LPCFLVVTRGPTHIIEIANQAFSRLAGGRSLTGRRSLDAVPEIVPMGILALLDRVYATGKSYEAKGVRLAFTPPEGGAARPRYVDVSYQPRSGPDGAVTGVIVSGFDVTKHREDRNRLRRLRETIRRQTELHEYVLENSPDIICSSNRKGLLVEVNSRMTELLLYEKSELIGRSIMDFVHPDDLEKTRRSREEILSGKKVYSFENRFVRKDGAEIPLLWSSIWSPKQQATCSTARDLTERYRIEAEIRRTQKMEALGQLTGGIAHDFNNLLTVISGNAELLADADCDPEETPILAAEISQAAERGADLTQRLLTFAQRQPLKPSYVRVDEVLSELMPLVRRAVEANIDIEADFRAAGFSVLADRALLEGAVLNLVINARDAMPQGGAVTIRSEVRGAEDSEDPLAVGQDVVAVTVADNGPGMPPDVLSRVFEPFFTTKGPGQGTGLGLAMVYGFAQQSGGLAKVETALGEGTSVSIILPAVVGLPTDAKDEFSSDVRRSVLVVKGDRQRLQLISTRLLSLGHEVTEVMSADDALSALASREAIDLVISDVAIPEGVSGLEFARDALAKFPRLSVIVIGAIEEPVETLGLPQQRFCLLPYPYTRKQLAACIHRLTSQSVEKQ